MKSRSRIILMAVCCGLVLLGSVAFAGCSSGAGVSSSSSETTAGVFATAEIVAASAQPTLTAWTAGAWDLTPISENTPVGVYRLDGGRLIWAQPGADGSRTTLPGAEGSSSTLVLYDVATKHTKTFPAPGLVYGLDLSDDYVAFTMFSREASPLYLVTLSSGVTKSITDPANPAASAGNPVIEGHYVVWQENGQFGPDSPPVRILAYDLTSGKTQVIADPQTYGGLDQFWVDEDWVVFTAWKPEARAPSTWAVRLGTGEAHEYPAAFMAQDLQGDELYYVPWNRTTGMVSELHRLDLSTGADDLIASGTEFQNVRVNGTHLVWASWENGAAYLNLRDLTTGTDTRIPAPGYWVGGLRLQGDLLIWGGESTLGYRVSDEGNYVFVYDLSSGQVTRLGPAFRYQARWYTDGQSVVIPELKWQIGAGGVALATKSVPPPTPFADVPGLDPYFTAVMGMKTSGAAQGYPRPDGGADFRPGALLTRAQFAKMLVQVLGLAVSEDLVPSFADLGPDDPHSLFPHQYVAALSKLGIIAGTTPGHFSPDANLTRAQLVTFIVRAAQKLYPEVLANAPTLMSPTLGLFDPVHGPNLELGERGGLLDGVVGYGPGWNPWQSATRAEAAQVLWNLTGFRP